MWTLSGKVCHVRNKFSFRGGENRRRKANDVNRKMANQQKRANIILKACRKINTPRQLSILSRQQQDMSIWSVLPSQLPACPFLSEESRTKSKTLKSRIREGDRTKHWLKSRELDAGGFDACSPDFGRDGQPLLRSNRPTSTIRGQSTTHDLWGGGRTVWYGLENANFFGAISQQISGNCFFLRQNGPATIEFSKFMYW